MSKEWELRIGLTGQFAWGKEKIKRVVFLLATTQLDITPVPLIVRYSFLINIIKKIRLEMIRICIQSINEIMLLLILIQ